MRALLGPVAAVAMLASLAAAQQPNGNPNVTAPSRRPPFVTTTHSSGTPAAAPAPAHEEPIDQEISLGQLKPTPPMWFYEQQMRMYRDPKVSVRRRAEFEADQRQQRLAATRWYGFDSSRPIVNPAAWCGSKSIPYSISGQGRATVIGFPYAGPYVPYSLYAPYAGPGFGMW